MTWEAILLLLACISFALATIGITAKNQPHRTRPTALGTDTNHPLHRVTMADSTIAPRVRS